MTRITEIIKAQEPENPFDALDLTPDTLNTMSDAELDELRQAVHEIWRTQGSKEDDDLAIAASIVFNNEYKLRGRELPNKDKLDEISEKFVKTAITGEEESSEAERDKEMARIVGEFKEFVLKCLPEYELVLKTKKHELFEKVCYEGISRNINLSRHSRFECMQCSKAPEFELIWAEGMARAWFCAKHFEKWAKEHLKECAKEGFAVDIDYVKQVSDGEVGKKFGDNRNVNVWPEYKAQFNKELKKGGED